MSLGLVVFQAKEKRELSLVALAESSNFLHPAIELNQLLNFTNPCDHAVTYSFCVMKALRAYLQCASLSSLLVMSITYPLRIILMLSFN